MGEFEGDHCRQTQQGPRNEFGCIASERCINQEDSHHRWFLSPRSHSINHISH
jgi:hypothetical protein